MGRGSSMYQGVCGKLTLESRGTYAFVIEVVNQLAEA